MKILITGCLGHIGSFILPKLLRQKRHKIIGLDSNFNNNSTQGREQKKLYCNNSQINSTKLRQQDFQTNLGKLFNLATKTKTLVLKNEKDIRMNKKNNKALGVVTDPDGEEDTSDACKKYPEAC